MVVEADDVRSGPVAAGIAELRSEVNGSDAFRPGTEVIYSEDGTVAQINVPTPGNGNDAPSVDALNDLRDEIIPATVGAVEGTTVNVSGDAASSEDFANKLNSRLPLIFAFVFGLAFLLLLVTFRSTVIPIKAIILNLLSVGAAYGILVLVFQKGNLESLLGFTSNGGVTNWLPLFLFVVLFGLSMDYHVFILSRVKELHDRGMSTDQAVQQGISTTAGTVTSAAFVMVGVFLCFVTLAFLDFKELGLGLAAAVLIDATIIRGVLLPASMKVLGDWNWYLPYGSSGCRTSGPGVTTPRPSSPGPPGPGRARNPQGAGARAASGLANEYADNHSRQRGSSSRRLSPGRREARLERGPRAGGGVRQPGRARRLRSCCSRAWRLCSRRRLPATTTATTPRTQSVCPPPPTRSPWRTSISEATRSTLSRRTCSGASASGPSARAAPQSSSASVPEREVDAYLRGVGHAEVEDLSADPPRYLTSRGGAPQRPPSAEQFWVASAAGPGRQAVSWEVEGGRWSVVAMNADGARGVVLDADVAAKVGWILGVGIGLLVAGVLLCRRRNRADCGGGAPELETARRPGSAKARARPSSLTGIGAAPSVRGLT